MNTQGDYDHEVIVKEPMPRYKVVDHTPALRNMGGR